MGAREDFMRDESLWSCPAWCEQDADEHAVQNHYSAWVTVETSWHTVIRVRALLPWGAWYEQYDGAKPSVDIEMPADADDQPGTTLDHDDWPKLVVAVENALADAECDLNYAREAYPGAFADRDAYFAAHPEELQDAA